MMQEHAPGVLLHTTPQHRPRQGACGKEVKVHTAGGSGVAFPSSDGTTMTIRSWPGSWPADEVRLVSSTVEQPQSPVVVVGATVQRVNQPEAIGIVRETRGDDQTPSWTSAVHRGSQLNVVPEAGRQPVLPIPSPGGALRQGSCSGVVAAMTCARVV